MCKDVMQLSVEQRRRLAQVWLYKFQKRSEEIYLSKIEEYKMKDRDINQMNAQIKLNILRKVRQKFYKKMEKSQN